MDKAEREREREQLVSIEGNRKEETPDSVTPCVRRKNTKYHNLHLFGI